MLKWKPKVTNRFLAPQTQSNESLEYHGQKLTRIFKLRYRTSLQENFRWKRKRRNSTHLFDIHLATPQGSSSFASLRCNLSKHHSQILAIHPLTARNSEKLKFSSRLWFFAVREMFMRWLIRNFQHGISPWMEELNVTAVAPKLLQRPQLLGFGERGRAMRNNGPGSGERVGYGGNLLGFPLAPSFGVELPLEYYCFFLGKGGLNFCA